MPAHKPTKTKLPVPVTPPKSRARQPRKPPKPPTMQIGPVAAVVRGLIERIGDMAEAIGPYKAFVTVMTITGMVGLHYEPSRGPSSASLVSEWPPLSLLSSCVGGGDRRGGAVIPKLMP